MSLTKILTTTALVGGMMFNYLVKPVLAINNKAKQAQETVIDYNAELKRLDELYEKATTDDQRSKIDELRTRYQSIKSLNEELSELETSISTDTQETLATQAEILPQEAGQLDEITTNDIPHYEVPVHNLAHHYLKQIMNIPEQPLATSPSHNFYLKRNVADMLIASYACELQHGKNVEKDGDTIIVRMRGHVSGNYIQKARRKLKQAVESIYTLEQIQDLANANPGISTLYPGTFIGGE